MQEPKVTCWKGSDITDAGVGFESLPALKSISLIQSEPSDRFPDVNVRRLDNISEQLCS